jgi:CubicO group peptidase (beta-lactamase class C family)
MQLTKSRRVLAAGIERRLHVGAQLCVGVDGDLGGEVTLGLARADLPMRSDSMMTWLSCSKIAVATAVGQLWETGRLQLDDPVAQYIPEFAQHGKASITLRHLLTHTCCLLNVENLLFPIRYRQSLAANIELICGAELDAGAELGRRAGYQTSVVSLLLAEILRRVDGRPFWRYAREAILVPLGMRDSWIGMPHAEIAAYRARLGQTFDTAAAEPKPQSFAPDRPEQLNHVMPGGNGRGPMRELVRLLEMLRRGGTLDGARVLAPQTVEAMVARQRCGLFDHSWGAVLDWGLGFTLDSKLHHAGGCHRYGYGRYASARTYGHSGFRTTTAFCDPEAHLVVACSWNGMVADDDVHSQRQNDLCDAIYQDLGLA